MTTEEKRGTLADIQEAVKKRASYKVTLDTDKVDPAFRQYAETINSLMKIAENLRLRTKVTFAENPFPILVFDRDWNIVSANQAYSQLSGIDRNQLKKMSVKSSRFSNRRAKA